MIVLGRAAMRRRGFTLLELLVAAGLSAVVLAGLWTMFSIFERLFTKAETQVERAQLARALMQQLADDLRSAIPDNVSVAATGATSVRRFGLFGTREALQVDVLQITARPIGPPRAPERGLAQNDSLADELEELLSPDFLPQAPELRTVRYTFEPPDVEDALGDASASPGFSGLVRREFDWQTPADERDAAGEDQRAGEDKDAWDEFEFLAEEFGPADPLSIRAQESSATWAPEVVGVEFRYFDGSVWTDQWNSLQRKSLPVAVEAVLRVRSAEPPTRPSPPRTARPPEQSLDEPLEDPLADAFEDPLGDPLVAAPSESPRVKVQTHRVLVHLPSTALAHGPKKTEVGPRPLMVPIAAPIPLPEYRAPAPLLEPPRRRLPLPDQWMRTGS
ncbi:MAG: prepilin-type N-terminal cleavage/methylation domain-containing protein [Thermoguttaceae bacterium]|jgi:prepilin-type N-terminal cleavage/methylation domain-containing protein|nr:prepilin-type N-terminal cleavage/methylation domain-containing protein [Thermoguttaceae bacterium]